MALTSTDIGQIKGLLDTQRHKIATDTERKINTAITNLEVRVMTETSRLESDLQKHIKISIQTSENNLKQLIQQRFDYLDGALENVTVEIIKIQGELHTDHEERIRALEQKIHIS